ncbi:MAG TPA: DUF2071 domain-containing protein [Bryobacteraceae bacterium]|nr:DUF2071 domain-containing protein [Bryobacteraceae bacterium]
MSGKKRIAILGGGVGAITTAFALTDDPGWQDRFEIDVYQMGWRLGGKGASGRNAAIANRIEEHGLHVWFGYYQNAFRMIRRVYDECTRLNLAPASPFKMWLDAFQPQTAATLWEKRDGQWTPRFSRFAIRPGYPGDEELFQPGAAPPRAGDFLTQLLDWLIQECEDIAARLDSRPQEHKLTSFLEKGLHGLGLHLHGAEDLAGYRFPLLHIAHRLAVCMTGAPAPAPQPSAAPDEAPDSWVGRLVGESIEALHKSVEGQLNRSPSLRKTVEGLDLAAATIRGMIADDVLNRGFASIDDCDLREWLKKHGARYWNSAQVAGIYDSSFGYRKGDQNQPNMAAGSTLYQTLRMFFTYRHAVCFRMRAGMGDTIFAPLYLLLRARGVRFHFFHRVANLALSADKRSIEEIRLDVQATMKSGAGDGYQPLCEVKGLPCWPHEPLYDQLAEAAELRRYNLESAYTDWHDRLPPRILKAGADFDSVVLGLSLGPLPYVCRELIEADPKWRNMVEKVETVQTHAAQWWFNKTNQEMGWQNGEALPENERALSSAFEAPLDSYADFTHVLHAEEWTPEDKVANIAYLCHALSEDEPMPAPFTDAAYPQRQLDRVREYARDYLRNKVQPLWPNAMCAPGSKEFDWTLLADREGRAGELRLEAQYTRANVDPSERYVLSVAGSTRYRLPSGESGFDNLYLAGDYTLNEFSAGLVEGAAISGLMASQAISGKPECIYHSKLEAPAQPAAGAPEQHTGIRQFASGVTGRVENVFASLTKRAAKPPERPWVLFMTWRDLLFASWRVPPEIIRAKVPPELELDTFDGSAWVSMVPMSVTGMHFRGVAPIPGIEALRELNLRTYVTRGGKGGVYFLSIECPAVVSDWMAVHFFGVPYLRAQIATFNDGTTYQYASERVQENEPPAAFFGSFRPVGEPASPTPGSLEQFLVERYSLYFVKNGVVYRGDIHHDDWKLQPADVTLAVNTIPKAAGLDLPAKPDHLVFSVETDTLIWLPVRDEHASTATL